MISFSKKQNNKLTKFKGLNKKKYIKLHKIKIIDC